MPTKTDILLIGIGAAAAVFLTWKVPSVVVTMNTSTSSNKINVTGGCSKCLTLEKIPGIDINSLSICKQKGLM